jgi:Prion-inhibition and propagation
MDPLSTVLSVFGLWSVASSTISKVSAYRDYPDESRHLFIQLELTMKVLHLWCSSVGILEGRLQEYHHGMLRNPDDFKIVTGALSCIASILSNLHNDCKQDRALADRAIGCQTRSAKWNGVLLRLRWTFGGEKKYRCYVQRIRNIVQDLHALIPPRSESTWELVSRKDGTNFRRFSDDFHLSLLAAHSS